MGGKVYEGILNDKFGGMTMIGAIIKDAWIFGVIPETETCEGWTMDRIQLIYDEVTKLRETYGFAVADYPPEIRDRHERIHREAIERARTLGWDADRAVSDEA